MEVITGTDISGQVQKPTVRGQASGVDDQQACRAAVAALVTAFRARAAGG